MKNRKRVTILLFIYAFIIISVFVLLKFKYRLTHIHMQPSQKIELYLKNVNVSDKYEFYTHTEDSLSYWIFIKPRKNNNINNLYYGNNGVGAKILYINIENNQIFDYIGNFPGPIENYSTKNGFWLKIKYKNMFRINIPKDLEEMGGAFSDYNFEYFENNSYLSFNFPSTTHGWYRNYDKIKIVK